MQRDIVVVGQHVREEAVGVGRISRLPDASLRAAGCDSAGDRGK